MVNGNQSQLPHIKTELLILVSISITPRIFLVFHGDFLPILEYMSCIKFYLCIRDKIKNPHGVIGLMQYISVSQNLFNGILLL